MGQGQGPLLRTTRSRMLRYTLALSAARSSVTPVAELRNRRALGSSASSNPPFLIVSVAWQGNMSTFAPVAPDTCGTGLYRDPRTGAVDETYRRLVSVDVYTVIPCACP